MADDQQQQQPVKSTRKTMAPAARNPRGADDPAEYGWLKDLADADLDAITDAVKTERQRRARTVREPSFGMSEGEREELERTGRTVSPFTGERRGDWSGVHGGPRTDE